MKKITTLILAILLCASMIASCGRAATPPQNITEDITSDITTDATEDKTTESETIKEEPKDEPTEEPKDEPTEEPKDEPKDEPTEEPKDEPKDEPTEEPKDEPKDEPTEEPKEEEPTIDPSRIVNVTPTNFAAKFSPENEELLKKILNSPIKDASVENALPSLTVKESLKYAAGDGGYTYIYTNVGKAIYDNCCYVLSLKGFAKYTENAINASSRDDSTYKLYNYFATFINDTAQIDIELHTGTHRMFINVTPRAKSILPAREAQSYIKPEGNYPTLWVQYGLEDIDDKESSLGYIIRIADGSFVIIDGGEYINGVEVRMYEILKKLAPDPNNIVVSAWIITHAHADHIGGFLKFAIKYIKDPTVKIKQLVCNFPDDSKITGKWEIKYQNDARAYAKNLGAKMLKVHTGNVLYYADIKINILYTQENYMLANTNGIMGNFNGSSVVTQFVMADGSKVLVGSDHPVDGSSDGYNWCGNTLVEWYGTALRSQVASTFHHGYGGGADNYIYSAIKPKMILWSADAARVSSGSLTTVSHNKYFTTNGQANGVTYHTASGSSVTILQFANGTPSLKFYSTFDKFKAS